MTLSLTEDFKTLAELQRDSAEILAQVRRTGRPVVITKNGKPDVVVMHAKDYEWLVHCLNLSRMIHEAEADVRAGRVRDVEEFLDELKHGNKVPRANHAKRRK
jgi:prevent-host-death family protein